jgi:hypothetical protein
MDIPPVFVGNGEGSVVAVENLDLADIGKIEGEGKGKRQEIDVRPPGEHADTRSQNHYRHGSSKSLHQID